MASISRFLFRATEEELFRHEENLRRYRLRKWEITSCRPPAMERVDGSRTVCALEATVERLMEDRRMKHLEERIVPVECAVSLLKDRNPELYRLVELKYFHKLSMPEVMAEMAVSEREYYRKRREAIELVAPFLFGAYAIDA